LIKNEGIFAISKYNSLALGKLLRTWTSPSHQIITSIT